MRTLKKTLSLVLVVAMVLGLCVVGASAYNKVEDFTDDVSKIGAAYYEAVGVLTGIGVIDGMTETAFEPQGNYTREQAAKIIAYMQLGKDKADSLKCTTAPFEDVAATRWSAGYIAYCVEQGIIDGMTETTFEPTGKLTGFQWAKMLLCAVGFGVKGEFTGSSWSVNTAKVAHTVDLFKGDLAGADHTAITREQAALYAFNVLTNVKKVAYSPNVTNYVFGIGGYEVVGGIGSTLGQDVFGLVPYTGIITANEGTGAKYTTLSKGYAGSALVANLDADTGIDMYYHAARIWAVNGVSVFVCDLAKTTTYSCGAINTAKAANASKVAGNTRTLGTGTDYEYDLIDNSAYLKNSYAGVTFQYTLGEMGVTTASGVTYIYTTAFENNTATIKAANIWTDISKINKGSAVIYLAEGGQYYIYAPTSTQGTIRRVSSTGAVTLTDGTVIEMSNLATAQTKATESNSGKTYTFLLDTHGHYYALTKAGLANLYFYTGEWKVTSDFNTYHGEHTYTAQFINVTTGEVVDLPVLASFVLNNAENGLRVQNFYDVGVADASGVYTPAQVTRAMNIYEGAYAIANAQDTNLTFSANTRYVDIFDDDATNDTTRVYLDNPTKFIVATGTGTKVEVKTYDSLAAMLGDYTGTSVSFNRLALTVYTSGTKNTAASVVFGFRGNYTSSGTGLFLPADISASVWEWDAVEQAYVYDGFYYNGVKTSVYTTTRQSLTRGFYSFSITNGKWALTADTGSYVGLGTLKMAANSYSIEINGSNMPVSASATVIDLRAGVKDEDRFTTVDAVYGQFKNNAVTIAFQYNHSTPVSVLYILDAGWDKLTTVSLSEAMVMAGWTFENGKTALTYPDNTVVPSTYTIKHANAKAAAVDYTGWVTAKQDGNTLNCTAQGQTDGTIEISCTVAAPAVRETEVEFDIPATNKIVFAGTSTVADHTNDFTVTANTDNYVLGTPLKVRVDVTTDDFSTGNKLVMVFSNSTTGFDLTATTGVIESGRTNYYVELTLYPMVGGTYTLSSVTAENTPA